MTLQKATENKSVVIADSISQNDSIDVKMASVKADECYFDGDSVSWVRKKLIGCWFVPHAAVIHIVFKENGTF